MSPTLPASVLMMAAMMLPSAVPAIARPARQRDGLLVAPVFGIAAVALVQKLLPPRATVDVSVALAIAALGAATAAT